MPITKSAKKARRQNVVRRSRNLKRKEGFKSAIKAYKKLIAAKKSDEAKKQLALVYKALDKAAKANTIRKNTASRLKSRLTRLIGK